MGNQLFVENTIDVSDVRKNLLKSRDEILAIVAKIHKQIGLRDVPREQDSVERAVELENLDVLFEIDQETRYELRMIGAAIERIEAGKYAICSRCGGVIDSKRLRAVPYIDTCIACASSDSGR